MRRTPLLVLAALLAAALTVGTAGAAMQETVRGHYTIFTAYDVDINAKASLLNTNASGTFKLTYRNSDPNTVYYGDVTCLTVGPGRTATVGGVITRVDPAGSGTGIQGFLISVQDNGSGSDQLAPDMSSFPSLLAAPPPTCTAQSFLSPINSGDITVSPVR
jgi:hypothetical protein